MHTAKKAAFYALSGLVLVAIIFFWWHGSGSAFSRGGGNVLIALGRLAGLLTAYFVLLQLMMIGRVRWLEPVFGLDKLSRTHHTIGILITIPLVLHPLLLSIGYSIVFKSTLVGQFWEFLTTWQGVLLAVIGYLLFVAIIILSIYRLRAKFKYETWYYIHLFTYAALVLAFFHQYEVGSDFVSNAFRTFWFALYGFVVLNIVYFRFFLPIYRTQHHAFYVDRVERETHNSVSIYIKGRDISKFRVRPGQFMIFRFLAKKFWHEAHPFSLSGRGDDHIRITVKASGDYTARVAHLKPGTIVLIDGPYGIFTKRNKEKFLLIAGGVGITPIRSLTEELVSEKKDVIVLYANRTEKDIIFRQEFGAMGHHTNLKVHHVLASEESWAGERGYVDIEKIERLCPDYKHREIYICGPVPMMDSIIGQLEGAGVHQERLHYEKFSL